MAEDNNRVIISGLVKSEPKLDHVLYGEEFYAFDVSIPRLSGVADTLPVTVSNRLMGGRIPRIDEQVTIRGQLRSYNKQIDNMSRLVITVFAKQFRFDDNGFDFVNDIGITGYICKPVVYRTTPFLREISDLLVAVNRMYGKSDYLPCIAWGRNAQYASKLPVGTLVHIEGRIQSRQYQKVVNEDESVGRVVYEISCSLIEPASNMMLYGNDVMGGMGQMHGNQMIYPGAHSGMRMAPNAVAPNMPSPFGDDMLAGNDMGNMGARPVPMMHGNEFGSMHRDSRYTGEATPLNNDMRLDPFAAPETEGDMNDSGYATDLFMDGPKVGE